MGSKLMLVICAESNTLVKHLLLLISPRLISMFLKCPSQLLAGSFARVVRKVRRSAIYSDRTIDPGTRMIVARCKMAGVLWLGETSEGGG